MVQTIVNAFVLCLMAHMIGDYFIQNDWMALTKTKAGIEGWRAAIVHGITYTIPFIPVVWVLQPTGYEVVGTMSPLISSAYALLVIGGTHIVLDHYYAAKHVIWAKNQLAPKAWRPPHTPTGFNADRPDWIAVWLMIIVDNCIHMIINTVAVVWL